MSIEEKARAEAKRLMGEVSRLQARAQRDSAARKDGTDKLIAEINRLQMAAVKERDSAKAAQVKQETQKLFEEQLSHIHTRQINTREQINRLMLAKQKYELALKNTGADDSLQDKKMHQQLMVLIKKKKDEYLQLNKESEAIVQRAAQKGIPLAQATQNNETDQPESVVAKENLADKAKAEAERLMDEVRKPVATKTGKATAHERGSTASSGTADKAEEVGRMIAEISRLQTAADQGLLSDDEMRELESRVHRIEAKQRQTRDQINQLTQAKIKYELALNKSAQERDQEKQRRAKDEKLQSELNDLIKSKEQEQSMLMQELHEIRLRSQQEAELLKAQRDAARALAEQQSQNEAAAQGGELKKHLVVALLAAIILLLIGLGVTAYFVLPWQEWIGKNEKSVLPKPLAPETVKKTPEKPVKVEVEPEPEPEPEPEKPKEKLEPVINVSNLGTFQDRLANGARGPKMALLPAGEFVMGSPEQSTYIDERPQLNLSLDSFAISQYPITIGEFKLFSQATGTSMPDDKGWGQSTQPVINVNWDEAVAYTEWLSEQTGHRYALPSEREWEYAARASTTSEFWWGNELGEGRANCAGCGSQWDGKQPSPVGSFGGNPFGIYDVVGNVLEWTRTCYRTSYDDAPMTGLGWEDEPGTRCSRRVVRSSAYDTYRRNLRLTKRNKFNPRARSKNLGFRVVRED